MAMPAANLKTAVLLLFKAAAPVVVYPDNPEVFYDEIKKLIKAANPTAPKLIEKTGGGPIKKVAFLDTELVGVSLQVGVMPGMP